MPLLEAEIEPLAEEVAEQERAELEVRADELEEHARALRLESERELRRHAAEYAETFGKMQRAYQDAQQARRAALQAAGAHREDVFRAEPKNSAPVLGSWAAEQSFGHVASALVGYAPRDG